MARLLLNASIGITLLQMLAVGLVMVAAPYFPEGEVIAYVSYGNSSEDIFILDVSRGKAHNLTSYMNNSHEGEPDWSADGSQIAFSSRDVESNMSDIFAMDMDGGNLRQLTPMDAEYDFSPAWSPDSQRLVYIAYRASHADVYIMDADGSDARPLTNTQLAESFPSWSPDGDLIAFGLAHESANYIYIADAVDGDTQQLIPGHFITPVWAPDGTHLAFMGGGFQARIYLTDVGERTFRSFAIPGSLYSLTWLPDSQHIAFVSDLASGTTGVYVMDIANGSQAPFPFGGYGGNVPVWRPS